MYPNNEILAFDGTVQGLVDQLDLLQATMPHGAAFVFNPTGDILNRVKVIVNELTDGSHTWDIEIYKSNQPGR